LQQGTNILGGNWLGGNAWLSPDGNGYSQTCSDTQEPIGICDQPYVIDENNIDYLPLSIAPTQPKPDLIVSAISIDPEQPIVNQSVTINATIANIGEANAVAFNVSFYANNVLIEKVRISGLNANESIIASISWTPGLAGNYTIKVIADSDNNVIESNENNNESSKTVIVTSRCVASLSSLIRPKGSTATVYLNVSNAKFHGLNLTIAYNASVVEFRNASSMVGGYTFLNNTTGSVSIVLVNTEGVDATDIRSVLEIKFRTIGNPGDFTYLNITGIKFSWGTENVFEPDEIVNGSIRVTVKGDFNGNGGVDIGDVVYVAFIVVGKIPFDDAADFNGDGEVDIADLVKIVYFLLGEVNEL